jgi:threonine/homoserine/homoserine lactone efflux protein
MMSFLNGAAIGLIAGFPAGPLGAIAIKEMIQGRRNRGFFRGMGAVTANFLYAFILVFGLGYLADFLLDYQQYLRLCGSVLIMLLGAGIMISRRKQEPKEKRVFLTLGSAYLSGFMIAVSNPAKITAYTGLLTLFSIETISAGINWQLWCVITGIVTGSFAWWVVLFFLSSRISGKTSGLPLTLINRIFGSFIILIGALIMVATVIRFLAT